MLTTVVKKYRKKPIVIEAIQWLGYNLQAVNTFCPIAIFTKLDLVIPTLEGNLMVSVGDYIIKGIKGECYPCKSDIFEMTYEEEL